MRAMVLGFLAAILACRDAGPSVQQRTIELSADSAAFSIRDSLVLVATVRDHLGNQIDADDVEWFSDNPALSVTGGVVKANAPAIARITARSAGSAATTDVWAQPVATYIRVGFSAGRLSPGATFRARVATWDSVNGGIAYTDYGGHLAKQWGTISSSNPAVADWEAFANDPTNVGWTVTAFAPGEAILRVVSGGLRDSLIVRVDAPVLTTVDSTWTGVWNKCGLTASGEAWCSGSNRSAELGTRTGHWYQPCCTTYQQGSSAWVGVDTDERFERLAVSYSTWCAISFEKRVLCWGLDVALGGTAPTTDCYRRNYPGDMAQHRCSFTPLLVDRELDDVLQFDDLRGRGQNLSMCGHVFARGPTTATVAPVDEYWCWGGTYGARPQQRPGYFE